MPYMFSLYLSALQLALVFAHVHATIYIPIKDTVNDVIFCVIILFWIGV